MCQNESGTMIKKENLESSAAETQHPTRISLLLFSAEWFPEKRRDHTIILFIYVQGYREKENGTREQRVSPA